MIPHKALVHQGNHPPIVERAVFDRVQAELKLRTRKLNLNSAAFDSSAMLRGRLFDADGVAMTPTVAYGKSGQRFRYYVSSNLQRGKKTVGVSDAIRRAPAMALETLVRQIATRLLPHLDEKVKAITRVEIHPQAVHIGFDPKAIAPCGRESELAFDAMSNRIEAGERWDGEKKIWWLRIARRLKFRGGRSSFTQDGVKAVRIDRVLAKAVCKGHAILDRCTDAQGQLLQAPSDAHERILIRLAFLAPDIQAAIFRGGQPDAMNLEGLRYHPLPWAWDDQVRMLDER